MTYLMDLECKTILPFKKFKTSGLVVKEVRSTTLILSKILSLFLSKSGPFLLRGSKNHCPNLALG